MLPPMSGIIAMSYAAKVTIALVVVFFVVFPLLVNGLLGLAGAQAAGEKADNDEYVEKITARK